MYENWGTVYLFPFLFSGIICIFVKRQTSQDESHNRI